MHPLLDVGDRLAGVEVLRARLGAVHDRVTPFGIERDRTVGFCRGGINKRDGGIVGEQREREVGRGGRGGHIGQRFQHMRT